MVEKIEMDSRLKHLENLERELKIYEEDHKDTSEAISIVEKKLSITKQMDAIKFDNFMPNYEKVLWKFEQDPKFIELTKELHLIEAQSNIKKMTLSLKSGTDTLRKLEENIKSANDEITRIKALIGDAQ